MFSRTLFCKSLYPQFLNSFINFIELFFSVWCQTHITFFNRPFNYLLKRCLQIFSRHFLIRCKFFILILRNLFRRLRRRGHILIALTFKRALNSRLLRRASRLVSCFWYDFVFIITQVNIITLLFKFVDLYMLSNLVPCCFRISNSLTGKWNFVIDYFLVLKYCIFSYSILI